MFFQQFQLVTLATLFLASSVTAAFENKCLTKTIEPWRTQMISIYSYNSQPTALVDVATADGKVCKNFNDENDLHWKNTPNECTYQRICGNPRPKDEVCNPSGKDIDYFKQSSYDLHEIFNNPACLRDIVCLPRAGHPDDEDSEVKSQREGNCKKAAEDLQVYSWFCAYHTVIGTRDLNKYNTERKPDNIWCDAFEQLYKDTSLSCINPYFLEMGRINHSGMTIEGNCES